jgi:hypothetical protein
MASLQAWGQSPSYLALLRCLDDFDSEDRDTDKSIVVITDGINYQFTPTTAAQATAAPTTQQDVLRAWGGRDIPVYILGFGISGEDANQVEREYRKLAAETGGEYFPINNGRDLQGALRNRTSLGGYAVINARNEIVSPTSLDESLVELNTPVQLPDNGATYSVSFEAQSRQIEVEGGEAIELYVSENGTDLVARPFDEGFPVASPLTRRGASDRFLVRAHRPSWEPGGLVFPISIQSESQQFTHRPTDVWIEITPVGGAVAAKPLVYGFYDANYESQQPVPLLRWTASNWPAEAREAAVRVWAKFTPTEPIQTIAIDQLLRSDPASSDPQPVKGVNGVEFQIDVRNGGQELKIVERHAASSQGVYGMKVKLVTAPELRPDRVVHQFDVENGIAIHSFFFSAEKAATLASSSGNSIAFFTRESLQQHAWTLDAGSLIVPIYGQGDTLPLNAATGTR